MEPATKISGIDQEYSTAVASQAMTVWHRQATVPLDRLLFDGLGARSPKGIHVGNPMPFTISIYITHLRVFWE